MIFDKDISKLDIEKLLILEKKNYDNNKNGLVENFKNKIYCDLTDKQVTDIIKNNFLICKKCKKPIYNKKITKNFVNYNNLHDLEYINNTKQKNTNIDKVVENKELKVNNSYKDIKSELTLNSLSSNNKYINHKDESDIKNSNTININNETNDNKASNNTRTDQSKNEKLDNINFNSNQSKTSLEKIIIPKIDDVKNQILNSNKYENEVTCNSNSEINYNSKNISNEIVENNNQDKQEVKNDKINIGKDVNITNKNTSGNLDNKDKTKEKMNIENNDNEEKDLNNKAKNNNDINNNLPIKNTNKKSENLDKRNLSKKDNKKQIEYQIPKFLLKDKNSTLTILLDIRSEDNAVSFARRNITKLKSNLSLNNKINLHNESLIHQLSLNLRKLYAQHNPNKTKAINL